MLRISVTTALIVAALRTANGQVHAEIATPPNGNNQRAETSQWIGLVKVSVEYHSPRVHLQGTTDRTGHIWGDLVHYGFFDDGFGPSHATPWRAGANETTTLSFSHDVTIANHVVKAGTYGLFLDVEKQAPWNWILSSDSAGWGGYQYDQSHDVVRIPVTPQDAPFTEYLTYGFTDRLPTSAVMYLQWENKRIPLEIDVPNVNELYIAQIRKDLLSWPGFDYQNWQKAAQFAVAANVDLDEALVWADKAISNPFRGAAMGRADFSTLATKATVLQALKRESDADTTMDRALTLDGANAPFIYQYGMSLLAAGRNQRAMQIFKLNKSRYPDDKFWTAVGLARGYTAIGDKKNAIANWETALQNVPPAAAANRAGMQRALDALKASSSQ